VAKSTIRFDSIILERLPPIASEDQRVRALADLGFSLSSMFYTVGATSISSDEVLKAAELKALREQ
jgi:hypothetical protein